METIPKNVVDKDLYANIKRQIQQDLKKKGSRWGVYASSLLVKIYKKMGGRYTTKQIGPLKGIERWYKEVWINICQSKPPQKIVKCGRKSNQSSTNYPVCRPYKRVTSQTPTTYQQMKTENIQKICRDKNKNPSKKLPKFV